MAGDKNEGEGNKTAARHYNEKTTAFAQDKDRVQKAAEDAKSAVSGREAEDLKKAEKAGLNKAKH
jgi:general stress protein YciG